jgi:predicted naringenin-chalcone synthase
MYLNALGTAVPPNRYSKADCWQAFAESAWFERLDARAHAIARTVLRRDNGIDGRWLALDSLSESFTIDPDTLHRRFATHAPQLAAQAGAKALAGAEIGPDAIDAVIVTTCTGYLCPALSGYVIEALGLNSDTRTFDLVGQGCAGAVPNWQLASALLDSGQCQNVLSICVEVCSAAMYLDNDPGVLISACLFGDGAGAAVLSARAPPNRRRIEWKDTVSMTVPSQREALRFEHRGGMLRNILTRSVPALAAEHADVVLQRALASAELKRTDVGTWILHAGGRDVLLALERRLGLDQGDLRYSRSVLREYGNLSSAFVYFVLGAALADDAPSGWWWLSSFGAGFACHGALLRVE